MVCVRCALCGKNHALIVTLAIGFCMNLAVNLAVAERILCAL